MTFVIYMTSWKLHTNSIHQTAAVGYYSVAIIPTYMYKFIELHTMANLSACEVTYVTNVIDSLAQ